VEMILLLHLLWNQNPITLFALFSFLLLFFGMFRVGRLRVYSFSVKLQVLNLQIALSCLPEKKEH
jgi:hypothetical protein